MTPVNSWKKEERQHNELVDLGVVQTLKSALCGLTNLSSGGRGFFVVVLFLFYSSLFSCKCDQTVTIASKDCEMPHGTDPKALFKDSTTSGIESLRLWSFPLDQ